MKITDILTSENFENISEVSTSSITLYYFNFLLANSLMSQARLLHQEIHKDGKLGRVFFLDSQDLRRDSSGRN